MKILRALLHQSFFKSTYKKGLLITAGSLAAVALIVTGCYNFYRVDSDISPGMEKIRPLVDLEKTIVVHHNDSVFLLSNIILNDSTISGNYIADYEFPYGKSEFPKMSSTVRYKKKEGDERLLNEVHVYLNSYLRELIPGYLKISFNLKDVSRLDVYNKNQARTDGSYAFGIVAGTLGASLVFLMTASCPYVYVNTENGYVLEGEIYSGAVYAPLERNDYMHLPGLVAENGKYRLKLTNEQHEIQNTNLTELFVVDHPQNTIVLFDKYGNSRTADNLLSPVSAVNFKGKDVSDFIREKDDVRYCGLPTLTDIPLTDGIILTFTLPEDATTAKLVIRARNSIWLDYVYKNSHDLFGSYYDKWLEKKNNANAEEQIKWSLSQNIPLSVYVERGGVWEFCDYFNMAGPLASRDDIMLIDLSGTEPGSLNIKLESGTFFWETDYAAIDFSEDADAKTVRVPADKIIADDEMDVTVMLRYDDMKYYTQAEMYESAELTFTVPPETSLKRSVFLHSKGYYQILSDAEGLPKINKLKKLRQPGQFTEFSRKLMLDKIDEFTGKK